MSFFLFYLRDRINSMGSILDGCGDQLYQLCITSCFANDSNHLIFNHASKRKMLMPNAHLQSRVQFILPCIECITVRVMGASNQISNVFQTANSVFNQDIRDIRILCE